MQPDINAPTNAAAANKVAGQQLLDKQNTESDDFLTRYRNAVGGQETTTNAAARIGGELGIPQLQNNATMLRNTLTNLPSTYSAAMRGFDVNNNQLQRIIGQKSSELSPLVTTAENSLSGAQNTLNTRLGYEQTDQAKALTPFTTEEGLLQSKQARETTMFTTDNEQELNALIGKMNAGVTLSEGEKNRANALSVQEGQYQNQLKLQQSAKPGTQIVTVGGVQKLINSDTGQVISTLGASSNPPPSPTPTLNNSNKVPSMSGSTPPMQSAPLGTITNGYYSTGNGWVKVVN